jgi:hypothetical protein
MVALLGAPARQKIVLHINDDHHHVDLDNPTSRGPNDVALAL